MVWEKVIYITLFLCFLICISCTKAQKTELNLEGVWHAELNINPEVIPFNFSLIKSGGKWRSEIYNAEEVLSYDEVDQIGDSLTIHMDIFDSQIKASLQRDGSIKGAFKKNHMKDIAYLLLPKRAPKTVLQFPVRPLPIFLENGEQRLKNPPVKDMMQSVYSNKRKTG